MSAPELLKQAGSALAAGNAEEAVAKYDEALALVPDEVKHSVLFNKAVALDGAGRTEEAADTLKEVLELKSDLVEARHNLAVFQLKLGQHDACAETVDSIIGDSTEPGQTDVRALKVQAMLDSNNHEGALEAANAACEAADADDAKAFRVRGSVLAHNQQWEDAITDFEYAAHYAALKGPDKQNYAMCLSQLSQQQQASGDQDTAIETMEKSLAVLEHARRRVVLASYLTAADRPADAVKAIESVALTETGDAEVQRVYGVALMKTERPFDSSHALELSFNALTAALTDGEEEDEPSREQRKNMALNAGVGAYQAKKFPRAVRLFQASLDIDPEWGMAKTNLFAAQQAVVDSQEEEEEEEEEAPGPLHMKWKTAGGGGGVPDEESKPTDAVKDEADPTKVKWKKQRRPTWKAGIKTGLPAKKSEPVAPPSPVAAGQDGYKGTVYDLSELTGDALPSDVDKSRKEAYLSASQFEEVFGMEKEDFYKLPKWKQTNQRKAKSLF